MRASIQIIFIIITTIAFSQEKVELNYSNFFSENNEIAILEFNLINISTNLLLETKNTSFTSDIYKSTLITKITLDNQIKIVNEEISDFDISINKESINLNSKLLISQTQIEIIE